MMKNRIHALLLLLFAAFPAFAQYMPPVPPENTLPECVMIEKSPLIFPGSRAAQDSLHAKIDRMVLSRSGNVNIWHVGGSHVQGAIFPNRLMRNFNAVSPMLAGGRGMLFPRRILKTNSDLRYRIKATGEWVGGSIVKPNKEESLRYGITGFAAATSDTLARVGFNMRKGDDSTWTYTGVRVMGYASSDDVRPYLVVGPDSLAVSQDTLGCRFDPATGSYLFDLPEAMTDSMEIGFRLGDGGRFTLTGIEPVNDAPGFRFYASGVNGASLSSWAVKAVDLERDLRIVDPDLVIFGIGINDSAMSPDKFNKERFLALYRKLVAMVRAQSPDCAIIFVTNNDSYRYVRRSMVHNDNGGTVRELMLQLAKECGGAVWDLYGVMGGAGSVDAWRDAGLVKKDRIHFTEEGYRLLGDLLYNAVARDHDRRAR